MAFPSIGGTEAIIILVVILIVFGVGKLPQVGGALGKGIREFRKGKEGLIEDLKVDEDAEEEAPKQKKTAAHLTEGKTKAKARQS
ncbi:MAG: twin-arginine translocase TatA/TatE family subunit [Dehalococcoidia bacterium]|nr:twin-arginine translocase TatA/TatE family subunit [Dehalococcoidia bacterium]